MFNNYTDLDPLPSIYYLIGRIDTEAELERPATGLRATQLYGRLQDEQGRLGEREEALRAMQASALEGLDGTMNDDSCRREIRAEAQSIELRRIALPGEMLAIEAEATKGAQFIGGVALGGTVQVAML